MTAEGLNNPVVKGDHQGLVEIMSHLLAVRDRQSITDKMFELHEETIFLLEHYGVTIPEQFYSQIEVRRCFSALLINTLKHLMFKHIVVIKKIFCR